MGSKALLESGLRREPFRGCGPLTVQNWIFPATVIDGAGFGRYSSRSTPSGPLPQGMHTSGGFFVSTLHPGARE